MENAEQNWKMKPDRTDDPLGETPWMAKKMLWKVQGKKMWSQQTRLQN
jgi:hypothetical protein